MATVPRLFVVSDLVEDGIVALEKDQAHYLLKVMRLGKGAEVRLFNGRHGEWDAVIDEVMGKSVFLKAERQSRPQAETPQLTLLFAPLKKTRTDFIVEKATELGVSVLQPVITERTQAERVRTDRLAALATEAAEQTERLDLPEVCEPLKLGEALAAWDAAAPLYFADESGDEAGRPWGGEAGRAPMFAEVLRESSAQAAGILIGPEGGFSPAERDLLRATAGVTPVGLGPRILRAETAAVSAITLFQALCGDWR
jgi:16S rRNA (uracil1498-N3)-methyltransferase